MSRFCLSLALIALCASNTAAQRKPRIIFNDDAQVLMDAPRKGTKKFVKAWLDREIKAVPFTTFVFLAATPDIVLHQSKVGEIFGMRRGPKYKYSYTEGIRGLKDEGTDILKVVTEHMHANNKEVLAAIRLSDTHHRRLNKYDPLAPLFAINNPHFVIKQPDKRTNETALDYSYPEVRNHRMAIMKELAFEYDIDGLELNFVRWAKHFPRDKGREKAPIMTAYVKRIRKMLDAATRKRKRKKRLTLGIRVPESIDACWLAGMDVETWVKSGWIDFVVVSTWNNTDPQLRVDQFTKFTKPAKVDTIVVMGNMMGSVHNGPPYILDRPVAMSAKHSKNYVGMLLTAREARGAAANFYTFGADSISFWNVGLHFGGAATATPAQRARIARWTQAVKSKETVFAGPRTYRYLPMGKGMSSRKPPVRNYPWYDEGRSPLGHVCSPVVEFKPKDVGKRKVFPFLMADGRNGEKLRGTMTFWVYRLTQNDKFRVDLNGKAIPTAKIRKVAIGKRRGGLPGQRFTISLKDCPPFRGNNRLGLTLMAAPRDKTIPYMEELEVNVQPTGKGQASNKPVKILIAVDSEGPTGVKEYWARHRKAGDPMLKKFRQLMTDDVNAAIAGCYAAGADEVYVKDDGFRDKNMIYSRLDKRAILLPSGPRLLHGVDKSFSGVMLIGLHAMEGAKDSVLAHTWSSGRRRRYWFNGKEGGEVAAYAIVAGHDHQVPIIMATGCTGLCREVHQLLGKHVVAVPVKHKRKDGSINLYSSKVTQKAIFQGAIKAIRTIDKCRPYTVKFPLHIRLQLKDSQTVDGYLKWRRKNKKGWPGRRTGKKFIEGTLQTTKFIIL